MSCREGTPARRGVASAARATPPLRRDLAWTCERRGAARIRRLGVPRTSCQELSAPPDRVMKPGRAVADLERGASPCSTRRPRGGLVRGSFRYAGVRVGGSGRISHPRSSCFRVPVPPHPPVTPSSPCPQSGGGWGAPMPHPRVPSPNLSLVGRGGQTLCIPSVAEELSGTALSIAERLPPRGCLRATARASLNMTNREGGVGLAQAIGAPRPLPPPGALRRALWVPRLCGTCTRTWPGASRRPTALPTVGTARALWVPRLWRG